ncbi:hypothetical protein [Roseomonas sp. BN140053]|uniref:hypothetical protein n=1 Tax=Roseomonas sp. BN140053 TaxID=3391898 RepID=UPI0039ED53DA
MTQHQADRAGHAPGAAGGPAPSRPGGMRVLGLLGTAALALAVPAAGALAGPGAEARRGAMATEAMPVQDSSPHLPKVLTKPEPSGAERPPVVREPTRPPAAGNRPSQGGNTAGVALRREDAANTPPLRPDQPVSVQLNGRQNAFFRIAPEVTGPFIVTTRRLGQGTDSTLALLDRAGTVIEEDDDGGDESLASRVESGSGQRPALVRAGTADNAGGSFEVVLTRDVDPGPQPFGTNAAEAARYPLPAAGAEVHVRLRRGQAAFFALPEGPRNLAAFTRNLRNQTDTVLQLLDASGQVVEEDDDGGEGLGSRLPLGEAGAGAVVLRAATLNEQAGEFDLAVEAVAPYVPYEGPSTPAEAANRPPLALGQSLHLRLRAGQAAVFALPSEDGALLALTHGLRRGTDTVLELVDPAGTVLAEDDDGGEGLSSRLALPAAPRPAFLRAHGLEDQRGDFELVLMRAARAE